MDENKNNKYEKFMKEVYPAMLEKDPERATRIKKLEDAIKKAREEEKIINRKTMPKIKALNKSYDEIRIKMEEQVREEVKSPAKKPSIPRYGSQAHFKTPAPQEKRRSVVISRSSIKSIESEGAEEEMKAPSSKRGSKNP